MARRLDWARSRAQDRTNRASDWELRYGPNPDDTTGLARDDMTKRSRVSPIMKRPKKHADPKTSLPNDPETFEEARKKLFKRGTKPDPKLVTKRDRKWNAKGPREKA